jgi:hypothetical protein
MRSGCRSLFAQNAETNDARKQPIANWIAPAVMIRGSRDQSTAEQAADWSSAQIIPKLVSG